LAGSGATFTDAHAITHPSQPNYLALFSGDTLGVTSDRCPLSFSQPNLGRELLDRGHTFTAFSEDLPAAGFPGCTSGGYARKHAPWADFSNLPGSVHQPYSRFGPDYAALPTVAFVVPNLCHDMHDCDVATGDAWLHQNLAGYVDWAHSHNSLLVITWDEADDSETNQIPTIVLGPMVRPGQYGERVDHYRMLRTTEDMYRLPHAGHSESSTPITDIWTTAPPPTR
ncbi:MAG TPA: alkaline phosphatase family protein, partial [Pseudonocardiaceae bacterium]